MMMRNRVSQSNSPVRAEHSRRYRFFCTALLLLTDITVLGGESHAYNKVWVESKSVGLGETGVTVEVWVVNDQPLTGFVLPLEMRDTDANGSYIAGSCKFNVPPGNRLGVSPLIGLADKRVFGQPKTDPVPCYDGNDVVWCSGPVSNTYRNSPSAVDFISPDGFMWTGVATSGPPDLYYLPAGSDSVAGTFNDWPSQGESQPYPMGASFNFVFDVNSTPGSFEIDTMCVCPANHLSGTDLFTDLVLFQFTGGVIHVGGLPPAFAFIPSQTVKVGQTLTFDVSATDPDGTIPSLSLPNPPANATLTDHHDGSGTFSFSPVAGQEGPLDVKFRASDGVWQSDTVVVVMVDAASAVRSLQTGEGVPSSYEFGPSYPNPFNASTVIRFGLPADRHVRLDVFDILGRRVRTLIDEDRPAGSYAVEWDGTDDRGSGLSTGVYLYRIQTSDFVRARSMVLLK
ncbi:MAG: FlgD immunoglobulin-like domain containing protein [Candidatus Zixiibacteriota bacterium]